MKTACAICHKEINDYGEIIGPVVNSHNMGEISHGYCREHLKKYYGPKISKKVIRSIKLLKLKHTLFPWTKSKP